MKTLFGNSCAKGCLIYFLALIAIVALTTMGLGGLKGRFNVDAQTPQGSILNIGDKQPVLGKPPGNLADGGTIPGETAVPIPTFQPRVQQTPTLAAPPGPTAPAGPVAFTPVPSQGGVISGEAVAPFYIVQSGDTLSDIAVRFGTTVDALRTTNGITGDIIQPGQLLYLPQAGPLQQPPVPTATAQALPQSGVQPTVVIPFMPNTGIIRSEGP